MTWWVDEEVQPDATVHVFPDHDDDDDEHSLTGHCWCAPEVEEQPNGVVLVSHRDQADRLWDAQEAL